MLSCVQLFRRTAAALLCSVAGGGLLRAIADPVPTPQELVISEINYNPRGDDMYEYIELANLGTNVLDLSGVYLTNASLVPASFRFPTGFAIPAGGFVLVARDTNLFALRYQTNSSPWYWPGLVVAGQWSDDVLGNSGATISLVGSNGATLCNVPYQSAGDWPERADGRGSSLELEVLPSATNSDAEVFAIEANPFSWTSSSLYNGSPGRFDFYVKTLRVNEVLPHSDVGEDWVELQNVSDQVVDLTGVSLTDNIDRPQRYIFADNTTLMPGQMLVLSESQLGFAFSELGDDVSILNASGTNIIRFLDTVDFPAMQRGETVGRFIRSDGDGDFTELRAASPGGSNALPRVGPVVISEIMYLTAAGHAQYIELTSITNAPTPLYDPLIPGNTWQLKGVGTYSFPAGTVVPAGASLIVCGSGVTPAAFRSQYGLGTNVVVLGPWGGNLDPDGETIQLMTPGDPEPGGFVPYYRVDHVAYRTFPPWTAVAAGVSLERIPLQAYGNDAAYWRGSVAGGTAGTTPSNRVPSIQISGETNVDEHAMMTLDITAEDPDFPWQSLNLTPLVLPPGSSFDPITGNLQWTPGEEDGGGAFPASFSASDDPVSGAASVTNSVSVGVNETNERPVWTELQDILVPAQAARSFPVLAIDGDLPVQGVEYSALGLPAGFSIEPATGTISGSSSSQGSFTVTVIATDDYSVPLSATNQFLLQIVAPLKLEIQSLPGQVEISFPGTAGGSYYLEQAGSLDPPSWELLWETNTLPTGVLDILLPASMPDTNRYFRLSWNPQ